MADCIFCSIINGDIPTTFVATSDHGVAFDDINPQAPTHVLVLPKRHVVDIAELASVDPEAAADVLSLSRKVATIKGDSDYRLLFNSGADAGQTVFHAHGHVLAGAGIDWQHG